MGQFHNVLQIPNVGVGTANLETIFYFTIPIEKNVSQISSDVISPGKVIFSLLLGIYLGIYF